MIEFIHEGVRRAAAPTISVAAIALTTADAATAQSLLHRFLGPAPGAMLSYAREAGDVDGDGHADVAVSSNFGSVNGAMSGSAWVYSGADGSVLHEFHGARAGDFLNNLQAAGDIDGDGFGDVIVTARNDNQAPGIVRVHSGADGSVLHEVFGTSVGDAFGWSIGDAGDVDADGVADFYVCAVLEDSNGTDSGRLRVYSGVDASVLLEFDGEPGDQLGFGYGADGGSDVDLDGHDDLVVAGRFNDAAGTDAGMVWVLSGADGGVLYSFPGDSPGHQFGGTARFAGDVDGDGHADILTGTAFDQTNGWQAGLLRVYSGATGAEIYSRYGDAAGYGMGTGDGIGDVDGDGFDDFYGGMWSHAGNGWDAGAARVYSGRDGATIFTIYGLAPFDHFAQGRGVGDVDGDGFPDLIVDSRFSGLNGFEAGAAWVFSCQPGLDCDADGRSDALEIEYYLSTTDLNGNGVDDECELVGARYCSPNAANSSGFPGVVDAIGSELLADGDMTIAVSSLPQFQFGYLLTSRQQGLVLFPGGSPGVLCLGGSIGRFVDQVQNSGSSGEAFVAVDLGRMPVSPNAAVQPGETWNFQYWHRDVIGAPTSGFTDAIAVTFQ